MTKVLLVSLVVTIVAVFAYLQVVAKDKTAFFSDALKSAHIETVVSIDGTEYGVKNGNVEQAGAPAPKGFILKALELAYARALAERSPLLALAGTNPDRLDKELAELEKTRGVLAGLQEEDKDAEAFNSLYPLDALRALASLERARLAFVLSGSDTDEKKYREALERAIAARKEGALAFQVPFLKYKGDVEDVSSFTLATTISALKKTVEEIVLSADTVSALAEARVRCIGGETGACDTHELAQALPDIVERPTEKTELEAWQRTKSVFSIFRDAGIMHSGGRIVALASSTCLSAVPGPYFFWQSEPDAQEYPTPPIRYVGDIFYGNPANRANKLLKGKISMPVNIINSIAFYRCIDKGQEMSTIAATMRTADFAKEHPEIVSPDRENLLKGGFIRDTDAISYLRSVFQDISSYPADVQRELYSLSLMFRNKSASLEMLVHEIRSTTNVNLSLKKAGWGFSVNPRFFFISESAFPSLFQAYNSSTKTELVALYKNTPWQDLQKYVVPHFLSGSSVPRADIITTLRNLARYHAGEYDHLVQPEDVETKR